MRRTLPAAAFVVGIMGALIASALFGRSPTAQPSASRSTHLEGADRQSGRARTLEGTDLVNPGEDPFGGSRAVDLAQAQSAVAFVIHRPSDPLASDKDISKIWLNFPDSDVPMGPRVAIEYSSGLQLIVEQEGIGLISDPTAVTGPDKEAKYDPPPDFATLVRRLAKQDLEDYGVPEAESIATVLGSLAYIASYGPDRPEVLMGSIMFDMSDKIRITLSGRFDRATLLRVANTVT